MHVDEEVLAPIRARYGEPAVVEWEGEITAREFAIATYDPARTHDVTLFILNGARLALIRKPMFPPDIWRPPGGGVKPGEDFVAAVEREGLEETGLRIELERYLVDMRARFLPRGNAELADARLPRAHDGRGDRAARHGRDRGGPLGDARGARRPASRAAPRDRPGVLALPRRPTRCRARRALARTRRRRSRATGRCRRSLRPQRFITARERRFSGVVIESRRGSSGRCSRHTAMLARPPSVARPWPQKSESSTQPTSGTGRSESGQSWWQRIPIRPMRRPDSRSQAAHWQ